ncbi:hypothetical protein C7N43_15385 [Sphingobacteriales bacterium UPWRP_1]|nr:hypothetical protein BVG80_08400 [Sphingobacteriales bacterium TSM_CSM]PSJ76159.1 hypothetical protein C7N43_15385 [Sphingobacteriales bacterium UPWRP_1]
MRQNRILPKNARCSPIINHIGYAETQFNAHASGLCLFFGPELFKIAPAIATQAPLNSKQ